MNMHWEMKSRRFKLLDWLWKKRKKKTIAPDIEHTFDWK